MRVLVVEDEIRQAAALKRGLEAEGFTVDVATNGPDGLWLATEMAYDAIVLDVMLPGMNGYKVCAETALAVGVDTGARAHRQGR
ncbi:MAG: response regulator [Acidimicrobiales bacterium]